MKKTCVFNKIFPKIGSNVNYVLLFKKTNVHNYALVIDVKTRNVLFSTSTSGDNFKKLQGVEKAKKFGEFVAQQIANKFDNVKNLFQNENNSLDNKECKYIVAHRGSNSYIGRTKAFLDSFNSVCK